MPISDYKPDPDRNTDISGIDIAEHCSPAGINNAIRQVMADIASSGLAELPDEVAALHGEVDGLETAVAAKAERSDLESLAATVSGLEGGGGGIPEAPADGKPYARKDAGWIALAAPDGESVVFDSAGSLAVAEDIRTAAAYVDTGGSVSAAIAAAVAGGASDPPREALVKAWAYLQVSQSSSIIASFNVVSVTRTSAGVIELVLAEGLFSVANSVTTVVTCRTDQFRATATYVSASKTIVITIRDGSGVLADSNVYVVVVGR